MLRRKVKETNFDGEYKAKANKRDIKNAEDKLSQ